MYFDNHYQAFLAVAYLVFLVGCVSSAERKAIEASLREHRIAEIARELGSSKPISRDRKRRLEILEEAINGVGSVHKVHVVKGGETLASVAQDRNLDLNEFASANGMKPSEPLAPGQTLRIPSQ